ncbi:MAG: hypothetical protein HY393_00730 [Candidatus Diapherotrites archaeon]|nr:hypothetical protein [Candidatus Diapherotrites archaeon]
MLKKDLHGTQWDAWVFIALAVLAIMLLLPETNAFQVKGAEALVFMEGVPYTYEFEVVNESPVSQSLVIQWFYPYKVEPVSVPTQVGAYETRTAVFVLLSSKEFLGQTYSGALNVKLGGEKIQKDIEFQFVPATNCPISMVLIPVTDATNPAIKIDLKNESLGVSSVALNSIQGLPALVEAQGFPVTLAPVESQTRSIALTPLSDFNGTAAFTFACAEAFSNQSFTVEKRVALNWDVNENTSGIAGFLVFPSLGSFSIDGIGPLELALDALLVFIILGLLVALFVRLNKRLDKKGNGKRASGVMV